MTEPPDTARSHARKRLALILLGGVLGVVVGFAGVYGIGRLTGNAGPDPACKAAVEITRKMTPLARGEVAAVSVTASPKVLPTLAFKDASGADKSLADWRGRTVLVNLWATWCVPCRAEMPALDRLQASLGGDDFSVVAVNVDVRNPERAAAFLDQIGVKNLPLYSDPTLAAFNALKRRGLLIGLPTSILVDKRGCRLGVVEGPAEWDSVEARALIEAARGKA